MFKRLTRELPLWLAVANLLLITVVAGCVDGGSAIVHSGSNGNGPL